MRPGATAKRERQVRALVRWQERAKNTLLPESRAAAAAEQVAILTKKLGGRYVQER